MGTDLKVVFLIIINKKKNKYRVTYEIEKILHLENKKCLPWTTNAQRTIRLIFPLFPVCLSVYLYHFIFIILRLCCVFGFLHITNVTSYPNFVQNFLVGVTFYHLKALTQWLTVGLTSSGLHASAERWSKRSLNLHWACFPLMPHVRGGISHHTILLSFVHTIIRHC